MIPLKHFLIILVLHWWTSQDARVDAYDSLLRDMIHPFLTCADENDIPRDKSPTSGLNNDITSLRIGYDAIMTCIQIKLPVLRKSSDPTEWFIGYMFDITVATDLKNNFSNSKAYDFTCLETDNQSYSRESCFNDTRLALNLLYQAVQEQNITAPQEILHTICNSATESRFRQGICAKAGDPCAADIQDFLRYVLFPVLAGRNCHISTPVVITETAVNSGLSLRKSAIFTCGNKVFGSDPLEQLFPPSESTVSRVTNTTAARIEQQHSMQRFCAKRHKYVSCVVDVINDGHYENYLTGNLLYTDTLQHAFDTLCDNQELILSQFECTFHAMSAGTCYGGVEDLLNTAAKKFRNTSSYTICMEMKSAVSCRVETQLKLCSAQFATVMERFYENLLGKKCYPAGLRPNAMTDLPPCYANFSLGMQQRMKNYEEHQNISIVVGTEMEYVCKNEVDSITDCMYEVVSNPQKSLDIFAAELYGAKNIKPLTERACDLVPMLKPNLQCVIHGFETLVNSAVNCLTEFAKGFPKLMNISDGTFNEKTAEKICGLIGSLEPCVTPVFTTCHASLGNRITALFREVKTACNNPSYQIKAKDGTSSASSYSYTTLLFVLIVLAYHVI